MGRVKRTLVLLAYVKLTLITNSYDVAHPWFVPGLGVKIDCVTGSSTHHYLYQSCRYMLWSMRGNMWKAPPLYVNKSCVFKCGASFNYNEETRVIEECIDKNI